MIDFFLESEVVAPLSWLLAGAVRKGVFTEESKQSSSKKCIKPIYPPAAWKCSGVSLHWWLFSGHCVYSHCLTAGFDGKCQILDKYGKLCLALSENVQET